MEALLVVDIQPETVKPRNAEGMIGIWNEVIGSYDPDRVAYIANLKPFARAPKGNPFAEGLDVVSRNVFFKRVPDAFTNKALSAWLEKVGVDSVKIIGIDGNWCIKTTALGAIKHGFEAIVVEDAVASANTKAFKSKTLPLLKSRGVQFLDAR